MHLWADVWNTNGSARLGDGPVRLISAEVTRRLDGIGRIRLQAAGTDARAVSLLQNERRVRLYADSPDGAVSELGRGIVRRITARGWSDAWTLIADGLDDLDALTRVNTLIGRTYSQKTPAEIAASLIGLVSGWSASASGGVATDARFDGMSVWRALLYLAESQGLHVRAGTTANSVEVGAFGSSAGVRLIGGIRGEINALLNNDDVALIERITIDKISDAAATRLYPLGAGIGEATLTLENSTRNTPYTIQSAAGGDGKPNYYLQDAAGVTAFGVIEKVGKFRQIAPLSNSPTDLTNAANALYDLAAAWLSRYSQRQDVYTVTCRKLTSAVRPGDKVRLIYRGVIERDGVVSDYADVDADFWVMEVTERAGLEGRGTFGRTTELTLSSIDRHALEREQIVLGALEELELDGVSVKPYFNRTAWVYDRLIDPAHPAVVPMRLTNATQKLSRCTVRIKTRPFTATATAATGGGIADLETNSAGDHAHTIGASETSEAFSGVYFWRRAVIYDATSVANLHLLLPMSEETDSVSLQTGAAGGHFHSFSVPDHNHALSYGLQQDTATPSALRLYIDGDDVTDSLGGEWAGGGGSVTFEVDITAAILANPPLQQEHEIKITCGGGRGSAEVSVEVYEVIQSIAV